MVTHKVTKTNTLLPPGNDTTFRLTPRNSSLPGFDKPGIQPFQPQTRAYSPESEEAATKIQAAARGKKDRKKFMQGRRIVNDGEGHRTLMPTSSVTLARRNPGHPSDRQLIAQGVARRKAEELAKNRIAESSFDGESTVVMEATIENKQAFVPAPRGMEHVLVSLNCPKDQQSAFNLLDEDRTGVLRRQEARAFMRSMGWANSTHDLDHMLDGGVYGKQFLRNHVAPEQWTIKMLTKAMEDNLHKSPNSSVGEVRDALVKLANGRRWISNNRLVEVTVANNTLLQENIKDVMKAIGAGGKLSNLDCEQMARNVCDRICQPPPIIDHYKLRGMG